MPAGFLNFEQKLAKQDALGEGYIIETPAKAWKNSGLAGTMVVVTKPEAKYSARYSDQLTSKEIDRFQHKKAIRVSKQEFRMIESQRISKYSRTDESMIPPIDSFRIGDYREINTGYRYIIRNNSKDSFEIVGKQKIRAVEHLKGESAYDAGRTDRRNGSTAERTDSKLGYDRNGDLVFTDGRALQENDRYLEENGASEQRISDSENDSDSGWGHLNFSTRSNTDGVSNRSLLANALETTAQNDIERAKIAEYKAKIDKMNAEEEKLYDLRAQIKALSFAKGKRAAQQLKALRDEATKTANRILPNNEKRASAEDNNLILSVEYNGASLRIAVPTFANEA